MNTTENKKNGFYLVHSSINEETKKLLLQEAKKHQVPYFKIVNRALTVFLEKPMKEIEDDIYSQTIGTLCCPIYTRLNSSCFFKIEEICIIKELNRAAFIRTALTKYLQYYQKDECAHAQKNLDGFILDILQSLPNRFSTQDFLNAYLKKINKSTHAGFRLLTKIKCEGIVSRISQGIYIKTNGKGEGNGFTTITPTRQEIGVSLTRNCLDKLGKYVEKNRIRKSQLIEEALHFYIDFNTDNFKKTINDKKRELAIDLINYKCPIKCICSLLDITRSTLYRYLQASED